MKKRDRIDKMLADPFEIKKWKYYIVDLTNLNHPIIVRKHLDNLEQANLYKERYYPGNKFDILYWKDAIKHNISTHPARSHSHKLNTAKYIYPPDCVTQYQKQLFRNVQRNKMKQKKRIPKLTETMLWDILDERPVQFVRRMKKYSNNHWVYSQFVPELKELKKFYSWPNDLRHLANIIRTLQEYEYDIGVHRYYQVALLIYKKWGGRIRRKYDKFPYSKPLDIKKVEAELRARGFVDHWEVDFDEDEDSYIYSVNLKKGTRLIHPELCSHYHAERDLYDHDVYQFQKKMGIPGYTGANPAGFRKRK